jgi:hypothetical protein
MVDTSGDMRFTQASEYSKGLAASADAPLPA